MCNLDVNQTNSDENFMVQTTTSDLKVKPRSIQRPNSSNLENIINSSRMVVMMDYIKNRPRKIILDTINDNSRTTLHKNKEIQLLSEIVFGNFSLSSKANGFKLHIIKNPSKMIISKLFNTPFNSVYYENKSLSRKISPDTGNNQSSSSNSSTNSTKSCFSSYNSINSSIVNHLSSNYHDKSEHLSPRLKSPPNYNIKNSPIINTANKNQNGDFFNENFEIYRKTSVMMSIIFTFSIPDENKAEFEEFIFHYHVLLESILNRISQLISDNSYNIYNGVVVDCWKQSKKWLISLLPRHSPEIYNPGLRGPNVKSINISNNQINVKVFEEVLSYFDRQKEIPFLAQIITGILLVNPNFNLKFFNIPRIQHSEVFPYKQILQNLGINTEKHTFNRIIVKGGARDKCRDQPSSWKDKLSSSLKFYKNKLNSSSNDQSLSQSDLSFTPPVTRAFSYNGNHIPVSKDMELLTAFIANLIRPVTSIAYQLHILPVEYYITETRLVQLDDNKTAVEIPLISSDGVFMDKEVLPQINELFYPNKAIDHIFNLITPLQGLVENHTSEENFRDQLLMESKQSQITYNNEIFHPDFLVIDTDNVSVKIHDDYIKPSSWVRKVLTDIVSLTKLADYCSVMGDIYLISALNDFSNKAKICKEYFFDRNHATIDPWLMTQYGLCNSDLPLFFSMYN